VGAGGAIWHYKESWVEEPAGSDNFNAVWGSSETDVFAVGDSGKVFHFNGTTWSLMASNTVLPLYGVWGTSDSDVFAVGKNGTIIHYNGNVGQLWSLMTNLTPTKTLNSVWGTSSSNVFAVGESGTVLHYSSSSTTTTVGTSTTTTGDTSTTTTGDTSTTTTRFTTTTSIPDCAFRIFARDTAGSLRSLRQLRDERLHTAIGALLAAVYYQNMHEVSAILREDADLRFRFTRITLTCMPVARELLVKGSAVTATEDMQEIYEFLSDLQDQAGLKLSMDIDFILRGIDSGWLLPCLGVTVE
jgi:hypothetical protein